VKLPRLSIAKLMVGVAVVAINLGIARILFSYNPNLPVGMAQTGLALQAAVFLLIFGRGRARAFCAGFLAFGLLAMITFIWGMLFAPNVGLAFDPTTGSTIEHRIPGSFLWSVWSNYFQFLEAYLVEPVDNDAVPLGMTTVLTLATKAALIWSLPQLFFAVVGGLLAHLIVRRLDRTGVNGSGPDPVCATFFRLSGRPSMQ
jgi:hypothetical protein